ncbi:MAG: flagellar basal-body rod protein FlgG [Bdellovibrionales bacterium]|nr:flagellar basal-body rod protein FlgG [Bdellovibrionales bacterium]
MIKALNTAASGMQAQQTNMDVVSNNLANVNTTAFKKSRAEFEELMYQTIKEPGATTGLNAVSPTGVQVGLGVKTASTQKSFEQGSIKQTDKPLDMQIEGNGFFIVQMPNGQTAYTRDGTFRKDGQGRIVDKNGNVLQPEMTIPRESIGISISPEGVVEVKTTDGPDVQVLGQIELANFVNPVGLKSIGANLYVPSPASGAAFQALPGTENLGRVAQGQLEMSNVNLVDEMVNMISAQRAYETNSKAVQAADQMLQAINSLR